MVKVIHKYYLKFPPFARKVIDFSITGFMNGMMVDYYHGNVEDMILGCDELLNKKKV